MKVPKLAISGAGNYVVEVPRLAAPELLRLARAAQAFTRETSHYQAGLGNNLNEKSRQLELAARRFSVAMVEAKVRAGGRKPAWPRKPVFTKAGDITWV